MNLLKLIGGPLLDTAADLFKSYQEGKLTKEQLKFEIETLAERHEHEIAIEQIKTNREEAKGNWFQSGWRPSVGWICTAGLAVNYLISPLAAPFGFIIPQVDFSVMSPILLGMLGLGGMRSYEKVKGVAK